MSPQITIISATAKLNKINFLKELAKSLLVATGIISRALTRIIPKTFIPETTATARAM